MNFSFPEPIELKTKLKDILEPVVNEKFYLSDKALSCFMSNGTGNYPRRERFLQNINRKNKDIGNAVTTRAGSRPTDNFVTEPVCVDSRGRGENNEQHLEPRRDGVTNTITTVQKDNYVAEPTPLQRKVCNEAIAKGLVKPNDAVEYTYSNARLKEIEAGFIKKQNMKDNNVMSTLKCSPQQIGVCVEAPTGTVDNYRIRKLTPKECWRLMGFDDEDFRKAEQVNSSTQLYKQAGNSIVVNVIMSIIQKLFGDIYGKTQN